MIFLLMLCCSLSFQSTTAEALFILLQFYELKKQLKKIQAEGKTAPRKLKSTLTPKRRWYRGISSPTRMVYQEVFQKQ